MNLGINICPVFCIRARYTIFLDCVGGISLKCRAHYLDMFMFEVSSDYLGEDYKKNIMLIMQRIILVAYQNEGNMM